MTNPATKFEGFTIQPVGSDEGRLILSRKQMTTSQLADAIDKYQAEEKVVVGLVIGIHEQHGVFYTPDPDWDADAPDALDGPIGFIPWVQIFELLGRLPQGCTSDFLSINGTINLNRRIT